MDFAFALAIIAAIEFIVEAGPSALFGMLGTIQETSIEVFNTLKSALDGPLMTGIMTVILLVVGFVAIGTTRLKNLGEKLGYKLMILFLVNAIFLSLVSAETLLSTTERVQSAVVNAFSGTDAGPMGLLSRLGEASKSLSVALEKGKRRAEQRKGIRENQENNEQYKNSEIGVGEFFWQGMKNDLSIWWDTSTDMEGMQINVSVMAMSVILTGVWIAFFVMYALSMMMCSILIALSPTIALAFVFDVTRPAAKEAIRQYFKYLLVPCVASLVVGFGIDNIDQAAEVVANFNFYDPTVIDKNFSGYLLNAVMLLGGLILTYSLSASLTGAQAGALGGVMAGSSVIAMQQMMQAYKAIAMHGPRAAKAAQSTAAKVIDPKIGPTDFRKTIGYVD